MKYKNYTENLPLNPLAPRSIPQSNQYYKFLHPPGLIKSIGTYKHTSTQSLHISLSSAPDLFQLIMYLRDHSILYIEGFLIYVAFMWNFITWMFFKYICIYIYVYMYIYVYIYVYMNKWVSENSLGQVLGYLWSFSVYEFYLLLREECWSFWLSSRD